VPEVQPIPEASEKGENELTQKSLSKVFTSYQSLEH